MRCAQTNPPLPILPLSLPQSCCPLPSIICQPRPASPLSSLGTRPSSTQAVWLRVAGVGSIPTNPQVAGLSKRSPPPGSPTTPRTDSAKWLTMWLASLSMPPVSPTTTPLMRSPTKTLIVQISGCKACHHQLYCH